MKTLVLWDIENISIRCYPLFKSQIQKEDDIIIVSKRELGYTEKNSCDKMNAIIHKTNQDTADKFIIRMARRYYKFYDRIIIISSDYDFVDISLFLIWVNVKVKFITKESQKMRIIMHHRLDDNRFSMFLFGEKLNDKIKNKKKIPKQSKRIFHMTKEEREAHYRSREDRSNHFVGKYKKKISKRKKKQEEI